MSDDPGQREVAYRLFAAEYDDANHSYSESDEERAPNYVLTPTGARVNRLFVVGVLTEVEAVTDDLLRGRVADPTGAFVLYAGQYQPDEQAVLERTDPPAFVAVTGKARTFQPDDSDQVYTSIRPESINIVDAETRDRWTVQAAEQTLARVGHAAAALSTGLTGGDLRGSLEDRGVDPALADGIPRAIAHYGTTPTYLDGVRRLALDAARVVAGNRDEVRELTAAPGDSGEATAAGVVAATPETDLDADRPAVGASGPDTATDASDAVRSTDTEPTAEHTADPEQPGTSESETAPGDATDATAVDTADSVETATADEEPGEFEPGEFDLPDEVREEVEEEYGTEFQSGSEVGEPGEADIPTPETETGPASDGEVETTSATREEAGTAPAPGEESKETAETDTTESDEAGRTSGVEESDEADGGAEAGAEDGDEVEDPQAAVLAVMEALDDGSGADREAVVEETRDRHGLTDDEVEDAIQGALMDGQCYEPDESSLKPI